MSREYPIHPLVGVGVFIKDGDNIVLIQRANEPGKGLWSIPGGMVELGEEVREAAKREAKEETGIDVEIDKLLDVLDNIVRDESDKIHYHYVLVDFLCHSIGGKLQASSDVKEAQWVKIEDIKKFSITKTLSLFLNRIEL